MTHSVVPATLSVTSRAPSQPPDAWVTVTCPAPPVSTYLQLLQIWALFGHHGGQELVLEPVPGDQEVDQGALGLHLGLVVGVEVLRVQQQAEVGVVFHLFVADLNEPGGRRTEGLGGSPATKGWQHRQTAFPASLGGRSRLLNDMFHYKAA